MTKRAQVQLTSNLHLFSSSRRMDRWRYHQSTWRFKEWWPIAFFVDKKDKTKYKITCFRPKGQIKRDKMNYDWGQREDKTWKFCTALFYPFCHLLFGFLMRIAQYIHYISQCSCKKVHHISWKTQKTVIYWKILLVKVSGTRNTPEMVVTQKTKNDKKGQNFVRYI